MSARVRALSRGFTLMELMVVVVIIGILAALAVPSLSLASYERDTYNDAGSIMQLFRRARTRAVGRGAATLISMTASGSDRGTFMLYEAVAPTPGVAGAQTPVVTCKYPTTWALAAMTPIDGVNLNGTIEQLGGISAQPNTFSATGTKTAVATAYLCYTPLGRSYYAATGPSPSFGGLTPTLSPITIDVTHTNGATIRSVLVPPNGMARVFSHL